MNIDPNFEPELAKALEDLAKALDEVENALDPHIAGPKFPNVSCSQCGSTFGAGDSGYSHCEDHPERVP